MILYCRKVEWSFEEMANFGNYCDLGGVCLNPEIWKLHAE